MRGRARNEYKVKHGPRRLARHSCKCNTYKADKVFSTHNPREVNRSSENDAGSSATSKSLFLTSKSEMLTSKSLFLMSKSEMLTSKSLFLTSKSEMLTSKSLFLTSKSEMLTRKSNFLINDVDCQLPPPGGEQNLALV